MPDIIQTISLQGVPLVSEQLKKVQTESAATANAINQIGAEAGGGAASIQNFFIKTNQAADGMRATAAAGLNLKTEIRALKPILGELGIAAGQFGGFARLAAASLPLFAASLGGKMIIDLTKFNEQLLITKDRLDVITKGPGAFQQVAEDAQRLGVPIGQLATAVEQFATAWKQAAAATSTVKFVGDVPPASLQSLKQAQDLATALVAQFQALGVDGSKAIEEFTKQLGKTGTVTGDMVRALAQASPRVAANFAKLFGANDVEKFAAQLDKVPISLQKLNLTISGATQKWVQFTNPQPISALQDALLEFEKNFAGLKLFSAQFASTFSLGFLTIINVIEKAGEALARIFKTGQLPDALQDVLQDMTDDFQEWVDNLSNIFQFDSSKWQPLIDSFLGALDKLQDEAQDAWDNIEEIFSNPIQAPTIEPFGGEIGVGSGLASGGLVRGPGTATSDSIFARLSAGEYVMNAVATRHWGVQMLTALNNMRMPNLLPQSTLMPRFAEGGPVTAPAIVNLHFGGESFALQASEGVAQALRKHAVRSRLVSTGRKPSWY